MANTVFMFPGVGSHYSGMGRYFYDRYAIARETFEEASDALGLDMAALCFEKERKAELDRLENAQTALVTVSVASFRVFEQEIELKPSAMLGYSLGEYSALCAAGALGLTDALKLVHARGVIVSEYIATVDGTMAWVNNLAPHVVEEICETLRGQGHQVYVSAYDTPEKTSISGTNEDVRLAGEKVVEHGGIAIPIKMSGPFHSPLMQPAADRYHELLLGVQMAQPQVPVIANRHGLPYGSGESVLDNLHLQLVQPVRWLDSLRYLLENGMTTAVEIGPKNVLQYLLQAVAPEVRTGTWDKEKDVRKTEQRLIVQEEEYAAVMARCLVVVAGTRNCNQDTADYTNRVVLPFRQIQDRYEQLAGTQQAPQLADVQDALKMMNTALEAKRLQSEERERRLQAVLENKILKQQA